MRSCWTVSYTHIDLEDYRTKNRDLYFNMEDSPYWVASTPEEMDRIIEASTPERARENCDAILRFYGEAETGHAAQSIAEYILSLIHISLARAWRCSCSADT